MRFMNRKTKKIYKLLAFASCSETKETKVLYYNPEDGILWVRPYELFLEKFDPITELEEIV